MKFRDDIDPERTWVTSDSHFGHQNIKAFCHRVEDVEQIMMEKWAQAVPTEDTLLHLGDLSWKSNAWFRNMIAPHLTGDRKLLIKGNHDHSRPGFYSQSGFKIVAPFAIPYGQYFQGKHQMIKHTISFSHYPWSDEEEGEQPEGLVRVHGHIHNNGYTGEAFVPFFKNHINISVEQTKYRPINLKLLLDGFLYGRVDEKAVARIRERQGGENFKP